MKLHSALALVCTLLPAVAIAQGQDAPAAGKTAVYVQTGYSPSPGHMGGGAIGGLLVRDVTSRLAVEASGSYLGRGMGSNGLTASASLLAHLRPTSEKAVPYLVAGAGIYRASFAMGDERFQGPMSMGGSMMGGGSMMNWASSGQVWDYGQMPHFYGSRLATEGTVGRYEGERSFTDPVFSFGGGLRIDLGSRLTLRPDLRALVVTSGGDTNTLGLFTINLGYRF